MFYLLDKPHFHPFNLAKLFWHLSFSISHFHPLSCFCSLQTELLPSHCNSFSELLGSMTLYEKNILEIEAENRVNWVARRCHSEQRPNHCNFYVTIMELQEHHWFPNKARQSSVLVQVWNGADVGRKEVR